MINKKCIHCQTEFTPNNAIQKYCNRACARTVQREKNRLHYHDVKNGVKIAKKRDKNFHAINEANQEPIPQKDFFRCGTCGKKTRDTVQPYLDEGKRFCDKGCFEIRANEEYLIREMNSPHCTKDLSTRASGFDAVTRKRQSKNAGLGVLVFGTNGSRIKNN